MMSVVHNLAAMNAQRQFGIVRNDKAKTTEKLSSGYKINRAADDAAGLTISEKMRSQIRGLNQGSDNIQAGISLIQIADGALAEVNDMLHRMTELSVKSANGTNTQEDRDAIQKEITQLKAEIDRVSESTEYNTMPLFSAQPDPITGFDGKITKLVSCSAYNNNAGLSEPYKASDGNYYPSGTLDFSKVNAENVKKLNEKDFTFVCGWGCGETFKFNFTNSGTNSASGLSDIVHNYTVDISGVTSGNEIVDRIMSIVSTNPPTYSSAAAGPDGVPASHSAMITNSGDGKLTVYSMDPSSTAANVTNKYPIGKRGTIDCSSFDFEFYPEPIKDINIQCSGVPDDHLVIKTEFMDCMLLGIDEIDVSTEKGALAAIDKITRAGSRVSEIRSNYGAYQNRLEHAYANNQNKAENTTAAESRIRDTDMAAEMVKLSAANILEQAGLSIMAQANQNPQSVLSLLQ